MLLADAAAQDAHEKLVERIFTSKHMPDRRWIQSRLKQFELRCAWFDVVENTRKLVLTGIAVLLGQGTMEQLVLGVLLSATILATTAGLRPYKRREDDVLAITCQGAVVANLALAIQLKFWRVESDALVQGYETLQNSTEKAAEIDAERAAQAVREDAIGTTLIVVAALPFFVCLGALASQLGPRAGSLSRRFRRQASAPALAAKPSEVKVELESAAPPLRGRESAAGLLMRESVRRKSIALQEISYTVRRCSDDV